MHRHTLTAAMMLRTAGITEAGFNFIVSVETDVNVNRHPARSTP